MKSSPRQLFFSPTPPSFSPVLAGCILLLSLILQAGCSREPADLPEVKKFVEQTRRDFDYLEKRIAPLIGSDERLEKVDRAVAGFFDDAGAMAGRSHLGVAVLDSRMNYLAGRVLSDDRPGPEPIDTGLDDFSYLEELFEEARSGIHPQALYFRDQEILTVCSAIGGGKNPAAYGCLFYDTRAFVEMWGFGGETFAEIDFSG